MADMPLDPSEVSYVGEIIDLDDLGLNPKAPQPPAPARVPADPSGADHPEVTGDYSSLLTEPIASGTQFGRAAIRLDTPEPAAVFDEQGLGFGWNELPLALSHYDLGTIKRIEPFRRGSRRAPKAVLSCDAGVFLLKRREATPETLGRIVMAHRVQRHLLANQFPAPPLALTRRSGSSLVRLGGHVYELFAFVRGEPFDRSPEMAGAAGRALGRMHKVLDTYDQVQEVPTGSYHQSPVVPRAIERARETFARKLPLEAALAGDAHLSALVTDLRTAANLADDLGASQGPSRVCHGDWHPGNMLYNQDRRIIGVVDYDSIRLQNPLLDLATGALQFSAIGGADASQWPDGLDVARFQSFMRGYLRETKIDPAQTAAVPWLMAEAMAVEVLLPIASRGAFAGIRGDLMLEVVRRKMAWLLANGRGLNDAVIEAIGGHSF